MVNRGNHINQFVSVRTALNAGFGLMALASAVYALWSVHALQRSEEIVRQTYDRGLIAINYARAAEANALRLVTVGDDPDTFEAVLTDLDVVIERSDGSARAQAEGIKRMIGGWQDSAIPADALPLTDDAFLVLTEFLAADSFVERESAVSATERSSRIALIGLVSIGLISVGLAALLSNLLVQPLLAFSKAAGEIAEGQFEAALPRVFGREFSALRRSVEVMQARVGERIADETRTRQYAETRLAETLDSAADAILILDTDGRVILRNRVATELIRGIVLERGADLAMSLAATGLGADEVRALTNGGEAQIGDDTWLSAAAPEAGAHGRVVVWSDISAFKSREEGLKAANEAKARFIAVMSHELRTPLNAIIGFSDLIASEAFGAVGDPQYAGFATEIRDSGSKLLSLINDILQFTNAQSTTYKESFEKLDPAPSFQMLAEKLGRHVLFEDKTLCAAVPDQLPAIYANPRHIQRGIEHLVLNAARFTAPEGEVELTLRGSGSEIEIIVHDTGSGMSPDELKKANGLFDQVDNSATRQHEGLGLGIPLARAIFEAHGGSFALESAAGIGTTVTVTLPTATIIDTRKDAA